MYLYLLVVPAIFGALLFFAKGQRTIAALTRLGAGLVIAMSIAFCAWNFNDILVVDLSAHGWLKYAVVAIEGLMTAYLIQAGIRRKSPLLAWLASAQFLILAGFELFHEGEALRDHIYIDKLSLFMILIVGVIGGLICVYAVEYMKDYHRHHPEVEDRRGMFFGVLFVFLSAMYGLVIANDMSLMLFCWEITSLASFLLIGYTQKPDAVRNSLLAININVFGGIMFSVGIAILGLYLGISGFHTLLVHVHTFGETTPIVGLAVFLISCAALTKSAQLPFSSWLLGAMVAPTPTSAMLHSSTMVKAGVYLLLRLAPLLGANAAGVTVTMVGGVTFFVAALLAVSQTDAKRVLAYSTISNLGLIVACAGIDTAESLWAAMMLIVFHAIAKSLLFLTVGSTEYLLGSRDIEDMDGLYLLSPSLTKLMIIGIAGMFLAPFGMLVSKWAAMKAFLDSDNTFIVLLVAFGSTVTLFYWTKWMGKLMANVHRSPPTSYVMRMDEKLSLYSLAVLVIVACLLHPLISRTFIIPYIDSNLLMDLAPPLDRADSAIIIGMMLLVLIIPVILTPIFRLWRLRTTTVYMAGLNTGDDENFRAGPAAKASRMELRNWYVKDMFGESVLLSRSIILGGVVLLAGFFAALGGIVS